MKRNQQSTSSTQDSITHWETYIDKDLDFSFQYPQSWKIETKLYDDNGSKMIFLDPSSISFPTMNSHVRIGLVNVQIHRHPEDANYIQKIYPQKRSALQIGDQQIPAIQNEEITKPNDTRTGMQDVHYYEAIFDYQKKWMYRLSVQPTNAQFEAYKAIFDQILSTFKFID